MNAGNEFFTHGSVRSPSTGVPSTAPPTGGFGPGEVSAFGPGAGGFAPPPQAARPRKRLIPFGIQLAVFVQRIEAYLTLVAAAAIFVLTLYALGLVAQIVASGEDAADIPVGASGLGALVVLLWGLLFLKIASSLERGARWAFVALLLKSALQLLGAAAFFASGTDVTATGEAADEPLPEPWGTILFAVTAVVAAGYLVCLFLPSSVNWVWRKRRRRG